MKCLQEPTRNVKLISTEAARITYVVVIFMGLFTADDSYIVTLFVGKLLQAVCETLNNFLLRNLVDVTLKQALLQTIYPLPWQQCSLKAFSSR